MTMTAMKTNHYELTENDIQVNVKSEQKEKIITQMNRLNNYSSCCKGRFIEAIKKAKNTLQQSPSIPLEYINCCNYIEYQTNQLFIVDLDLKNERIDSDDLELKIQILEKENDRVRKLSRQVELYFADLNSQLFPSIETKLKSLIFLKETFEKANH